MTDEVAKTDWDRQREGLDWPAPCGRNYYLLEFLLNPR